jgi:hypothetical protein
MLSGSFVKARLDCRLHFKVVIGEGETFGPAQVQ